MIGNRVFRTVAPVLVAAFGLATAGQAAPYKQRVIPANTYHFASTSVGATVEFSGTGPFRIEYAEAKDDPR